MVNLELILLVVELSGKYLDLSVKMKLERQMLSDKYSNELF